MLLLVGYGSRKAGLLDGLLTKGLSGLLLKVALPALIIDSMQKPFSASLLRESGVILLISLAVYACTIILAFLFSRLLAATPEERGVFSFVLIFSNVGFMGYPVVYTVFGEAGVFMPLSIIYRLICSFLRWVWQLSAPKKKLPQPLTGGCLLIRP